MINTYVNVWTSSTEVLDLTGTEWATIITLRNESDSPISLAFWWDEAVVWWMTTLRAWEPMTIDTEYTQINIIKAISTWAAKKLTVQANVTTPWVINNFKLLNDTWESSTDYLIDADPILSWDFASNTDFYEISLDNGSTWNAIWNVNTYTPLLTDATYQIKIRWRKYKLYWTATSALTITVDKTSPVLSTVTIASDNINLSSVAKAWDTITLTIVSNTDIQTPVVTILWKVATIVPWVDDQHWTATYETISWDIEWVVPFTIAFIDIAWNIWTTVTATTNASAVTFDKTKPIMLNAVNDTYTQITVTLSELALHPSIVKSDDWWFIVKDLITPATAYAVSAINAWLTDDKVILTVDDFSASSNNWLKITYSTTIWTVQDIAWNTMDTDATWVLIPAWI